MPEGARLLAGKPGDRIDQERRHAAIILRARDEDDVVAAPHLREANGRLGHVVGLQILVEDRHVEIA
ncbi:hypothetical protein D3C87_1842410 [compost metagenome]